MEEFTALVTIDQQITEKKATLAEAQAKIDALKIELKLEEIKAELDQLNTKREELAIAAAPILSEIGKCEFEGYEFRVQRGAVSVQMKDKIDLKKIPPQFVRTKLEPDKNAIKKASPSEIEAFATLVKAPDKITYTLAN